MRKKKQASIAFWVGGGGKQRKPEADIHGVAGTET